MTLVAAVLVALLAIGGYGVWRSRVELGRDLHRLECEVFGYDEATGEVGAACPAGTVD